MPGKIGNIGWRGAGVMAAVWCATLVAAPAGAAPDTSAGDDAEVSPQGDARTAGAQSADGEARALVKQLGDPDFKVREAAAKRLKDMGRDALPALTEALAQAKDPEVCSRADTLMRRIQRPAIPSDWLRGDGGRGFAAGGFDAGGFAVRGFMPTQVRTSVINGKRVVEVNAGPQRRLTITEGPAGIEMTVTGTDDGEPVTARFRARSIEELQENDPDAFAIYQRWAGNGRGAVMRGRRMLVPDVPMPLPMPMQVPQLLPPAQFRGGAGIMPMPVPLLRQPADDIAELSDRVERQMRQANTPDDQQRAVRDLLDELQKMQLQGRAALPAEVDRQVQRYNALSDALREKLSVLKLPDPGDSLPPPAKSRLGISGTVPAADMLIAPGNAQAPGGGVLVNRVQADSRGAKLGLLEGDVIKTINGKAVPNVLALRRMVTEAKEPLALEVTRDGKPVTLKEKAANGQ